MLEFELSFRLAGWLLTFHAIQLEIISSIPTNLPGASYTPGQQLKYLGLLKEKKSMTCTIGKSDCSQNWYEIVYADIWHQKQQLHIFSMFLKNLHENCKIQRCTSWTILINFVAKSIVLVSEVLKIRNHVTNIVEGSDIGIPNTYYGGGKLFQ